MQNMKSRKLLNTILLISLTFSIAACQTATATQPVSLFGSDKLTPYNTATATATITLTLVNAPTATSQPTITPTIFVYVVTANDTLWTIAAKNGITVDAIKAANPDINPYTLSAGMKVIVPPSSGAAGTPTAPSVTAIPMVLEEPHCTPSLTGGLYCFALVQNNQDFAVQNLTGQFTITDPVSGDRQQQVGFLPLTHLPSQASLPLFAYFPPPTFTSATVTLELLAALPVNTENDTTRTVKIQDSKTEFGSDGSSATVKATLALQDTTAAANHFWVAAVAYDAKGNILGVRQLNQKADLSNGQSAQFTLYIYSVDGKIDHVDLFGEARQEK